ncbi:MAG: PEP-CTERM sorting domain-containing protein [Aquabacterium sp.]|jgi:hypothetical protein|nr:MAG: PEP-CTERM sorting domain-containing protein [Aquabacterium sp.]TAL18899.1 MAG: PEP-CTERM sorting domain-containing protein [Aquabacterium sp.]
MKHYLGLLATAASLCAAPLSSHAAQAIVGSWYSADSDFHSLTTLLADGRYFHTTDATGDAAHTGVEWGTWSWNEATGLVTASAIADQNGDWGLAGDVDGDVYFHVSGNTGTITQAGNSDVGTTSRVPTLPGSIVGAWFLDSGYSQASVAFFADGTYFLGVASLEPGEAGVERGTYSWDAATGQLRILGTLTDTSSQSGLAGQVSQEHGYYLATISGSSLLFREASTQEQDIDVLLPPEAVGAVPEPSSLALLLAGAGLVAAARRRN